MYTCDRICVLFATSFVVFLMICFLFSCFFPHWIIIYLHTSFAHIIFFSFHLSPYSLLILLPLALFDTYAFMNAITIRRRDRIQKSWHRLLLFLNYFLYTIVHLCNRQKCIDCRILFNADAKLFIAGTIGKQCDWEGRVKCNIIVSIMRIDIKKI